MHCNDLKYGDIVDFYYITNFCSMKVKGFYWGGGGGGGGLILGLLFRRSEYGL